MDLEFQFDNGAALANSPESQDLPGVYRITTPNVNELIYIGSAAVSITSRWVKHVSALRKGVHHAPRLQNVAKKYGLDALKLEVVCNCTPSDCVQLEQLHLDEVPRQLRYNTNPKAGSRLGAKLTEKQILEMRERRGGITSETVLSEVREKYLAGTTQAELATHYQVDRATIRNYLREMKVEIRLQPTEDEALRKLVAKEYLDGSAVKELSKRHRLDHGTVVRLLELESVQFRSAFESQMNRFRNPEARMRLSDGAGATSNSFIHPVHGEFRGRSFELALRFGLKSRGNITQLIQGKRAAYCGWELITAVPHVWKRNGVRRSMKGKDNPNFGKAASQETRKRMSATRRRLSDDQIEEIRQKLEAGIRQGVLARAYGVDQSVVSRIKTRGRRYVMNL